MPKMANSPSTKPTTANFLLKPSFFPLPATVIGFPNGYMTSAAKAFEARDAIASGADEVDIVLALNAFLEKDYAAASREITEIGAAIRDLTAAVYCKIGVVAAGVAVGPAVDHVESRFGEICFY